MNTEIQFCLSRDTQEDEKMLKWIEEYILKGTWSIHYSFISDLVIIIFVFDNEEDAVAFKLRWI